MQCIGLLVRSVSAGGLNVKPSERNASRGLRAITSALILLRTVQAYRPARTSLAPFGIELETSYNPVAAQVGAVSSKH